MHPPLPPPALGAPIEVASDATRAAIASALRPIDFDSGAGGDAQDGAPLLSKKALAGTASPARGGGSMGGAAATGGDAPAPPGAPQPPPPGPAVKKD